MLDPDINMKIVLKLILWEKPVNDFTAFLWSVIVSKSWNFVKIIE